VRVFDDPVWACDTDFFRQFDQRRVGRGTARAVVDDEESA